MEAYRKEFGKEYPGWGAKENGQASGWLKSVSLERALGYCRAYPIWNEPQISRLGHPFGLLIAKYVQLDAWLHHPDQIADKMASGRAYEKVLVTADQNLKEMIEYADRDERKRKSRMGLQAGTSAGKKHSLRGNQHSELGWPEISNNTEERIPAERSPFHDNDFGFEADAGPEGYGPGPDYT